MDEGYIGDPLAFHRDANNDNDDNNGEGKFTTYGNKFLIIEAGSKAR